MYQPISHCFESHVDLMFHVYFSGGYCNLIIDRNVNMPRDYVLGSKIRYSCDSSESIRKYNLYRSLALHIYAIDTPTGQQPSIFTQRDIRNIILSGRPRMILNQRGFRFSEGSSCGEGKLNNSKIRTKKNRIFL
jgi:hypothetical protein